VRGRNLRRWLVIFLIGVTGCSLDYREGEESGELRESVPDVVFNRFVHTAVNGEKLVFQLEAEQAKLFNKKKITVLSQVRFIEYDESGAVSLEGRARNAVFHTDTENADLSGGVQGYSVAEKVSFTADSLFWKKDERLLQSQGKEIVRIDKDDGSYIAGMYFTVDVGRKSLSYDAAVRGTYIRNEDEKKNQ
jgi:LPS export ABC transporter protein LptC